MWTSPEILIVTNITGVYKNGFIQLLSPVPADWLDGQQVLIPSEQIDITGDSPEAVVAWEEEFRQIHSMIVDDGFYEELQDILAQNKAEDISQWDKSNEKLKRIGK